MKKAKNPQKILWPVDALQCDVRIYTEVQQALLRFFGPDIPPVQPVYILSPNATNRPLSWFDELLPTLHQDATTQLDALAKSSLFPLLPPEILVEPNKQIHAAIDRINTFAQKKNVDLIVIPTQGKSRIKRMLIGSFAESMLMGSTIPLLTVNPGISKRKKQKRCFLIPIDFESPNYKLLSEQILDKIAHQDLEAIFIHSMPLNLQNPQQIGQRRAKDLSIDRLIREHEFRKSLGEKIVAQAQQRGLRARMIIDISNSSPKESILKMSEKLEVDFIAMPSEKPASHLGFTGSTTRFMIRKASCPVWAFSYKRKK